MPRSNGTYSLPATYLAQAGTVIRSAQHNAPLEDIAQALTNSLPRDGSAPMTGNLQMNNRRIIGLPTATASNEAVRFDQLPKDASVTVKGLNRFATPDEVDNNAVGPLAVNPYDVNRMIEKTWCPPGCIMAFGMDYAPYGWLLCDGAWKNKNEYPKLFNAIGYRFGGNGDNFALPDTRGQFLRGHDRGRGLDPGRIMASYQGWNSTRMVEVESSWGGAGYGTIGIPDDGWSAYVATGRNVSSQNVRLRFRTTGRGETRPINLAVTYCIKF